MESQKSDAIIVSAFGRGHSLAAELAASGISVTLLDVSHRLGRWSSDDWEGPFGYFRSEKFSSLQKERLIEEEPPMELPQGFTLWPKEGPLDLKSSLTLHRIKALGLAPECLNYFTEYDPDTFQKTENLKIQLENKSFSRNWMARLSHHYSTTRMTNHSTSLGAGEPLNLTAPFHIRYGTRPGFEKSLNWVSLKNVKVIAKADIVDVAFQDMRVVEGLEIRSEHSGLYRADQVIWCITSEETKFISDRLQKTLFPRGHIEADWSWVRYRFRFSPLPERDILPSHFLLMEDIESPWTHENFTIVRRTTLADCFDVWMCVPSLHRFQKQYLEQRALKWTENMASRLPGLDPTVVEFPAEHHYSYDEVGAARFSVFEDSQIKRLDPRKITNWHWDGPEVWDHHSFESIFGFQNSIKKAVLDFKSKADLKKEKKK